METIIPVGSKILVVPVELKDHITDSQIVVVQIELKAAKVVEVGLEVRDVYKKDDIVIYPKGAGVGQMYRGQSHFWLDGRGTNNGGEIWGIVTNDE